jgi:cyanophycinase
VQRVFLIGGGRDPAGVRASHAPFVAAAGDGPIAVVALEDPQRWEAALRSAGAADVRVHGIPPTRLDGVAGVYVAGGHTPTYAERCVPGDWLPEGVPYAGFSAGAAIAAERAVVGGWRVGGIPVCPEDAGEDLDEVAVRPGLGLVPFSVDVHAAQWGTALRLLHAPARAREAWAIDEHTALEARDGRPVAVHGDGHAHRLRDDQISAFRAGDPL